MVTRRRERIAEFLHDELSILLTELEDKRLDDAMIIVTHVDVSADLRNARVYVEHQLPKAASRQVLDALYHSEPFLRKSLVERLDLRYIPHLSFHVDEAAERGRRVDELLDMIASSHQTQEPKREDESNDAQ